MISRKLDFSKLNYHNEPLSMEKALKDVVPLNLSDDIINGKKIRVKSVQKNANSNCVRLDISY